MGPLSLSTRTTLADIHRIRSLSITSIPRTHPTVFLAPISVYPSASPRSHYLRNAYSMRRPLKPAFTGQVERESRCWLRKRPGQRQYPRRETFPAHRRKLLAHFRVRKKTIGVTETWNFVFFIGTRATFVKVDCLKKILSNETFVNFCYTNNGYFVKRQT